MATIATAHTLAINICWHDSVTIKTRDVFNNASARSAIECFLPERKRSPRCLQALDIQVDRCIARKSKMATKTMMGYREGLCTQYFQI